MKPVRLTMQAFGPYPEREIIDFRAAIDAGLFGIYGQTGSGKSTIFSAMTFALFGESAKTDQEAPSLRSDLADAGIQTEVEFVFDIAGQRFVVVRRPDQMRPKQRGGGETRSVHEAFLFDATGLAVDDIREGTRGKILTEKKVRDVDLAIADILGYGPDQFRQIVLLPQGRFEKFLAAKTKERLDILRELFDVSIYGALMARLKADAEAAERDVREERAACARQLAAEGFESTDALAGGISDAEAHHAALLEIEQNSRGAFEKAQEEFRTGEIIETQFKLSESTYEALSALQARNGEIDTLASRVAKAEQARTLIDVEHNVADAKHTVGDAEGRLILARNAASSAIAKDQEAAKALKNEMDRADEIDALRRQVEEYDRHHATLEKAASATEALRKAQGLERDAVEQFANTRQKIASFQTKRRDKGELLKVAGKTEARRKDIVVRLATLQSSIAASKAFEKAEKAVQTASSNIEEITARYRMAMTSVQKARAYFESAEQTLSTAQSLHLASKLVLGEPCSVCGSTEHPAPATGAIENAGREQAFRDAKAAWENADAQARKIEQELSGAQSVLSERKEQLVSQARPELASAVLMIKESEERQALKELGPEVDITQADSELAQLDDEISRLEAARDTLQGELSQREKATASENSRLEEMLAAVPEGLRDGAMLTAAREAARNSLAARLTTKERAEKAAAVAHDTALAAEKDRSGAESLLTSAQERCRQAIEILNTRLLQVGMSDRDFAALKPFIAAIDQDRSTVDEHRRRLKNAQEAADTAADVVRHQTRPDLTIIGTRRTEASAKLSEATEKRSAGGHRLNHLTKLRDSLADTFRRLEEAELASGSLRELAGMVNGGNSQRLDLETFAIGAMFDQVLEAANLRLGPMTGGRYRMQRDLEGGRGRRGLGIEVFDLHTGKPRPTTTLSGGETFVAALALALGLADIVESVSGKVRLDTIFIDEGFGSLDAEGGSGTLDKVLDVLNTLVSQNRAVGLISHVPLVQEAIPNGFYVRKHPAGSHVETRGAV